MRANSFAKKKSATSKADSPHSNQPSRPARHSNKNIIKMCFILLKLTYQLSFALLMQLLDMLQIVVVDLRVMELDFIFDIYPYNMVLSIN